jgi:hypothetical protein
MRQQADCRKRISQTRAVMHGLDSHGCLSSGGLLLCNSQMIGNPLTSWATLSFSRTAHTIRLRMYAFWIVAWYDFRCHIPECDYQEAIYHPDWLPNAVPFEENKPSSCKRFPPASSGLVSTAGPLTNNGTDCPPDIFNNQSKVGCQDWVFETEERTIANEVTFVYMSDRLRSYINPLTPNDL